MKTYLVRSGKGQLNDRLFMKEGRLFLSWVVLNSDLSLYTSFEDLRAAFPLLNQGVATRFARQAWRAVHELQRGDIILMPADASATIHIGRINGDYCYHPDTGFPSPHSISVEWIRTNVPYAEFDFSLVKSLRTSGYVRLVGDLDITAHVLQVADPSCPSENLMHLRMNRPQPAALPVPSQPAGDRCKELRDQIHRQISMLANGDPLIYRRIIKSLFRLQDAAIERLKDEVHRVEELLVTMPAGQQEKEPDTLLVHLIAPEQPLTTAAIDVCAERMRMVGANSGLIVSWYDREMIDDACSAYAAAKNVRCMTSVELIDELARWRTQLDRWLLKQLPDKLLFALCRMIAAEPAVSFVHVRSVR